MKGAATWRKVGTLEIGAYVDSNGRKRLCIRGECDAKSADAVCLQIQIVSTIIENDAAEDDHPQARLVT